MDGDECGMDVDADGCEVKIVKQDGDVMMDASDGGEMHLYGTLADTLQLLLLLGPESEERKIFFSLNVTFIPSI